MRQTEPRDMNEKQVIDLEEAETNRHRRRVRRGRPERWMKKKDVLSGWEQSALAEWETNTCKSCV